MQSIDSYMHVDPYSNDIKGKFVFVMFVKFVHI